MQTIEIRSYKNKNIHRDYTGIIFEMIIYLKCKINEKLYMLTLVNYTDGQVIHLSLPSLVLHN